MLCMLVFRAPDTISCNKTMKYKGSSGGKTDTSFTDIKLPFLISQISWGWLGGAVDQANLISILKGDPRKERKEKQHAQACWAPEKEREQAVWNLQEDFFLTGCGFHKQPEIMSWPHLIMRLWDGVLLTQCYFSKGCILPEGPGLALNLSFSCPFRKKIGLCLISPRKS